MPTLKRRSAGAALRAGALIACVTAVELALVSPAAAAASELRTLLRQPAGELSTALEDVATLTALLAWTWLLLLVVATVLSALRGAQLPHPQGLARHLAPRAAQRAVLALLGLGTALATAGTASAAAYEAPQQLAAAGLRGGVQTSSGANPLAGLPLPDRPSGTSPASSTTRDHHPDTVVVRRGDTLWSIAASAIGDNPSTAAIARSWPDWYAANRAAIGNDPDFLLPGTVLEAPRSATSAPRHPLPPEERS